VRPGALAVVALVCALLGGGSALLIAEATGWHDAGATVTRVADELPSDAVVVDQPGTDAAKPVAGNGFDPAKLYRARAAGVVTIIALFGEQGGTGLGGSAQGSGFVVSPQGYVLTNAHVITTAGEGGAGAASEPASEVYVAFRDGDRVAAKIIGWDLYDDVGLVKVNPKDHALSPVPLGDSSQVVVGEPVAAIGSPFGNETSLSVGVVSATERSIESLTSQYNLVDAIQTDAPINRGNSGGPLFDARGRVIGLNAQIRSESGTAEGVGFAVPINAAKRSMEQLIAGGRVRYAWVGIETQTLTPRLARRFGFTPERGAAVQRVVADSPADDAGLRGGDKTGQFAGISFRLGGDVIVAIDGAPIDSAEDVVRKITDLAPGRRTTLTVFRGSERMEIDVVLGARPANPSGSGR
jgi:S1-C subfamily serine protease